jgi:hypothetical protein
MVSRAWISVLVDRRRLDYELAEGGHPHSRPELELRARQLQRPRTRRSVAGAIEGLVHSARGRDVMTAVVLPRRHAVLDAREPLLELAARLRAPAPAAPRGVALAGLLLVHPLSPVNSGRAVRTIEDWVAEAHAALR